MSDKSPKVLFECNDIFDRYIHSKKFFKNDFYEVLEDGTIIFNKIGLTNQDVVIDLVSQLQLLSSELKFAQGQNRGLVHQNNSLQGELSQLKEDYCNLYGQNQDTYTDCINAKNEAIKYEELASERYNKMEKLFKALNYVEKTLLHIEELDRVLQFFDNCITDEMKNILEEVQSVKVLQEDE